MQPPRAAEIRHAVRAALTEDIGSGDATTLATVTRAVQARAVMRARKPLTVAGLAFADTAFRMLSSSVKIKRRLHDGQRAQAGQVLLEVCGPAHAL